MIVFKKLVWSNFFSYGELNEVLLDKDVVTQVVGTNGMGKSSIPLILQEVLFNKNIKGIKKADIPNRYAPNAKLYAEVHFEVGSDSYVFILSRKSTVSVELKKNGVDFSDHSSTGTYKRLEKIIGIDFKTFAQLTYQSSTSSLEFLTATDTARKKFLLTLFNLGEYTEIFEKLKAAHSAAINDKKETTGEVNALASVLEYLEASSRQPVKSLRDESIYEVLPVLLEEKVKYEKSLQDIELLNNKIKENIKHKKELAEISKLPSRNDIEAELQALEVEVFELRTKLKDISELRTKIIKQESIQAALRALPKVTKLEDKSQRLSELTAEAATLTERGRASKATYTKYEAFGDVCGTCNQPINEKEKAAIIEEAKKTTEECRAQLMEVNAELAKVREHIRLKANAEQVLKEKALLEAQLDPSVSLSLEQVEAEAELSASLQAALQKIKQSKILLEKVSRIPFLKTYIDPQLPDALLDKTSLAESIKEVTVKLSTAEKEAKEVREWNASVHASNSKLASIKEQQAEHSAKKARLEERLAEQEDTVRKLDILKKAFGTNGLLSHKLEYLVTDLENTINDYLTELTSGRFQLSFKLREDKLNIDIIDNAKVVTIDALSGGELARVNTASLLAIRKLMSNISNTRTNVLFLDEITGVLDDEGKEKLIEILLKEDLNTFIVSHDWTHPLVAKLYVTKNNNISEIEYGG